MRKNYYIKLNTISRILLVFVLMLSSVQLFADGSKDLYPNNAQGYRAFLKVGGSANEYYPFPNNGTHYVYAKAGERITMASSAQNMGGNARIRLFAPNGNQVVNNTTGGQIPNRSAELAGPQLYGQTGGGRYTPIYYEVTVEGLYRVEFTSRGTGQPSTTVNANSNWTQANNAGLAAWDVSVINSTNTGFISGRVYTNVLNFSNGTSNPQSNGFYGIIYVLTKDGYTYKVSNNGNNGLYFTFLVNNNGIIDNNGNPTYRSLNTTSIGSQVHDPNEADTQTQITHKMFYTLPASDLPVLANGAVPGNSTWLKNPVVEPEVTNVQLVGVEGVPGQVSSKGGYVKFNASTQGNYTVQIQSDEVPAEFAPVTLTGIANAGINEIFWDGNDGNDNPLPVGEAAVSITVRLQGAEVHFPYFDMEYNRFGTIIELLNHNDLNTIVSDIVYWDDTGINTSSNGSNPNPINNSHLPPANSSGISSNTNGHIWGVGGSGVSGQFGDNRSIDTWTFIEGEAITLNTEVEMKIADLSISSITSNQTIVAPGSDLIFTVNVKNDGPSDAEGAPFSFRIPEGLSPENISFNANGCGSEATSITFDPATQTYSSELNLPAGCEITYTFSLLVNIPITNDIEVEATILRPNDLTDPDATNPDPLTPPTDPHYECENNGLGGNCNNIMNITVEFVEEICTEPVEGEVFEWNYPSSSQSTITETLSQPASNYGFVLDIYTLDNSFNMEINGTHIATQEIEFQSSGTSGINVRFSDGDEYETDTEGDIWEMTGTVENPLIRVVISSTGAISLFGSKTSGGPLFPLELINGNSLNTITWNNEASNVIVITQNVVGATSISGSGYGVNRVICPCVKPASLGTPTGFSNVGILTKGNPSIENWPEIVPNGYLVLDAAEKGMVVTHMNSTQRDELTPIDGMVIYNTDERCLQLYRGISPGIDSTRTGWNCIKRGCNEEL